MSNTEILKVEVDTKAAEAKTHQFSKTWETEMQRVSNATRDVGKHIKDWEKEVGKATEKATAIQGAAKGFEEMAAKLAPAALGLAAVTKGFDLLTSAISKGITAALEYDATLQRLAATYQGDYGDQAMDIAKHTNEQINALQQLTNVSDETIRSMISMGRAMGLTTKQSLEYTQAAIRLSNATGMELDGAMKNLVKTNSGLTGELGESLPMIKELTAEELKAGEAVKVVNREFAEQLDTLTKGTSGAAKGLSLAWDDFTEALGRNVTEMPGAESGIRVLTRALAELTDQLDPEKGGLLKHLPALASGGITGGISSILGNAAGRGIAGALFPETQAGDLYGGAPEIPAEAQGMDRAAYEKFTADRLRRIKSAGGGKKTSSGGDEIVSGEEFLAFSRADMMWQLRAEQEGDRKSFSDRLESVLEEDLAAQQSFNDKRLELERTYQDGLTDTVMSNLERRAEIEAAQTAMMEEEAERRRAATEKWTSFGVDAVANFASAALDSLVAFANGADVEFDQVVKGFLESTGMQIIGMGIKDVAMGISRGFSSYGFDPTAYGLITSGGIAIGVGTAMIGGSLLIPPSQGASSSGGGSAGLSGGAGGAGGSVGASSGGGGQVTQVRREVTINVIGKPTAELGRFLRDAEQEATIRGL